MPHEKNVHTLADYKDNCIIIINNYYYYYYNIFFMQGIHTYIPETNHVSRVYTVTAIPCLPFMVHTMLSSISNSFVLLHYYDYYLGQHEIGIKLHKIKIDVSRTKLLNEGLQNLQLFFIRAIKSRRMRRERHVACMVEKRNAFRPLVGKPKGKTLL
jgi:hypothetical protein